MKIAVYTANFGEKDDFLEPINYKQALKIDFYLFTDDMKQGACGPYQPIYIKTLINDITKNARKLKILGHTLLQEYDMLIWHDANIQLNFSELNELIVLAKSKKTFITTFNHSDRDDFYSEAMSCIRVDKDSPIKILRQVWYYFINKMPAHNGLYSTGILIKNYIHDNEGFLKSWWYNTMKYSRRDQLSLAYTIYKKNEAIGVIEGDIFDNKYSKYNLHNYKNYIFKDGRTYSNNIWQKKITFFLVKVMRKIRKML